MTASTGRGETLQGPVPRSAVPSGCLGEEMYPLSVNISLLCGKFKFTALHWGHNVDVLLLCELKENKDIQYFPEILR